MWGIIVPAMTFKPLGNISRANCFASFSVGNDFDSRGVGARDEVGRHSLGPSTETYQRLAIAVCLDMTRNLFSTASPQKTLARPRLEPSIWVLRLDTEGPGVLPMSTSGQSRRFESKSVTSDPPATPDISLHRVN